MLAKEGKNPFLYDSKDPKEDVDMLNFLEGETRYATLKWQFPEVADDLFKQAVKFKQDKHNYYKKLKVLLEP
jgi:pyruvate-ferredoxin/flavodoxin oxidoreductase